MGADSVPRCDLVNCPAGPSPAGLSFRLDRESAQQLGGSRSLEPGPPAAPALAAPLLAQTAGDIGPIEVGRSRITVEFTPPTMQKLGAFRFREDAHLEKVALLAVIPRPLQAQAGRVEEPPNLRSTTVLAPQPHHESAAARPGVAQVFRTVEQRTIGTRT